jgi:hypothetical protein
VPIDSGAQRTDAAGADHAFDRGARSDKYRFDGTVAPVANPAFDVALTRMVLDKVAKADALHAAPHDDMAHDTAVLGHPDSFAAHRSKVRYAVFIPA